MSERDQTPEAKAQAQRMAIIEAFSDILKQKRKDAIEGRRASGIEEVWTEDEAHYDGEDQTGRGMTKGRNMSDGLTEPVKKANNRSTVFLKITRPYCDAAAARVSDMLLPTDDRNWEIRPTPLPQLLESMKDQRPVTDVVQMAPPPQKPGGMMAAIKGLFAPQEPQQPQQPAAPVPTVAEVARQEHDRAVELAKAAQEQIDDWLTECRYHAEVRKVIESAAKIGTGILKGPTPKKYKHRAAVQTAEGWTVRLGEKIAPESKAVSAWNLYPDPACGDNIHDGSYVWESDDITARKLHDLKGTGYIDEMIDQCLEEGPIDAIDGTRKLKEGDKTADKDLFQIWYFHGQVGRKDMEAAGCKCSEEQGFYPCLVTMVNDRVIKVALSHLDSGEFPYDVMVWQANTDHWAGVGVSRQMRECQKGANAAIRNVMDNAGLAAGPQIIVDRSKIVPANGRWEIVPRKVWWTKDTADSVDVRGAFITVKIDMLQAELMPIVQFWLQKAEDTTGLPMILQGQQGQAPDTVGGMQMMNNNGSTVLRRIARTFDDRITEPHIGRYYEYLLLHGPDGAKGEFTIDARGSSALLERDMQNQQIPQLVAMSLNPAYGLDPELVMAEFLKGLRLDPKRMVLSQEKKEAMAKQPPPKAPQVEVAELREKGATERKQLELQATAKQGDANRSLAWMEKQLDAELAREDLTAEERRDLQKYKVDLASLTMELNQQAKLSPGPQVREPPTEPAGQAPNGMAYPQ